MHALIIEDEALIAMQIKDVLREVGYETFTMAETEEDAVVAASIVRPDLIVSDVRLATGNGIKAVQRICPKHHIAVVFVTASADQLRGRSPPPVVVEKPFRPFELLAGVDGARSALNERETSERYAARNA